MHSGLIQNICQTPPFGWPTQVAALVSEWLGVMALRCPLWKPLTVTQAGPVGKSANKHAIKSENQIADAKVISLSAPALENYSQLISTCVFNMFNNSQKDLPHIPTNMKK